MGKRELILIAVFAALGLVVYQATAPPPAPGEQGFSVSRMLDNVRREMRANSGSAETTHTSSVPVPSSVTELRVNVTRGPVTVVGEARDTVESELHVRSTGADNDEARTLAGQTTLVFEEVGSLLMARVAHPTPGRQTTTLTLRVPERLRVRLDGMTSQLEVSGVAAVEAAQAQGETAFRAIAGRVTATHRGGTMVISDAGGVKVTVRGSRARIDTIRGDAEISAQGGDVTIQGMGGALDLNGSGTRIDIEGLAPTAGSLRVVAAGGAVAVRGGARENRIDLRNAPLDLWLDRPAEIAVLSEGEEAVRITAPKGGFRLDAQTRAGRITSDPADLFATWGVAVESAGGAPGERVTGSVNGGGPLLTIRARSDIRLSSK